MASLAFIPLASRASEEDVLNWRSIRVECLGTEETGKVGINASLNADRFAACEVTAFGKTHTLAAKDLNKLRGFSLDKLRITHEAGYPRFGGHTVHFKLVRMVFSPREQKTTISEVVVSVSKGQGLAVGDPTLIRSVPE